jgi:hypothetical protein
VLFNNAVKLKNYIVSVRDELMSMEHWWFDSDTRETEVLGEKATAMPFHPTQLSQGLTQDQTSASAMRGQGLTASAMAQLTTVILLSVCT